MLFIRNGRLIRAGIELLPILSNTPPLLIIVVCRYAVHRFNKKAIWSIAAFYQFSLSQGITQIFRIGMQGVLFLVAL